MPSILVAIIGALVPVLVNEAEKIFSRGNSGSGQLKHQWVTDFVSLYVVPGLQAKLPDFLKPDAQELADLVDAAIEEAVAKL